MLPADKLFSDRNPTQIIPRPDSTTRTKGSKSRSQFTTSTNSPPPLNTSSTKKLAGVAVISVTTSPSSPATASSLELQVAELPASSPESNCSSPATTRSSRPIGCSRPPDLGLLEVGLLGFNLLEMCFSGLRFFFFFLGWLRWENSVWPCSLSLRWDNRVLVWDENKKKCVAGLRIVFRFGSYVNFLGINIFVNFSF